jgi:hypothetical protein
VLLFKALFLILSTSSNSSLKGLVLVLIELIILLDKIFLIGSVVLIILLSTNKALIIALVDCFFISL